MASPTVALDLTPVILAGGSGTRLWPLSRRRVPKHLIALGQPLTLLQATVRRVLAVAAADRVLTVGAVDQADLLALQLQAIDPGLLAGLVLEPAARNTAAACTTAALLAAERYGPRQVLWICAADHLMGEPEALYAALGEAATAARDGNLLTFGIEPAYPEPGFGYIQLGAGLGRGSAVHRVRRFIEKPLPAVAQAMLDEGGYLWNSGMFVFRADLFLEEMGRHAPAILEATRAAVAAGGGQPFVPGEAYGRIPAEPVDKAVMERSQHVAVVPCDPQWSDVGSWHAVWEVFAKDPGGNAIVGDGWVEGSRDCLIMAGDRLVAAVGVEGLAIIDTPDAVMVADRTNSAAVKDLVGRLHAAGRREAVDVPQEMAPWGERRPLLTLGGVRVSALHVAPGATLEVTAERAGAVHLYPADAAPVVVAPGRTWTWTNPGTAPAVWLEVAGVPDRP